MFRLNDHESCFYNCGFMACHYVSEMPAVTLKKLNRVKLKKLNNYGTHLKRKQSKQKWGKIYHELITQPHSLLCRSVVNQQPKVCLGFHSCINYDAVLCTMCCQYDICNLIANDTVRSNVFCLSVKHPYNWNVYPCRILNITWN